VLVSGFDEHAVADPGSVPGASWVFRLDDLERTGAFLAFAMNGAPLSAEHGHPVRLVVPGWYACASVKWVNEIALVDDEAEATDHMREYAGRTHQDPAGPRDRALMEAGRRPEGPRLARDFRPAVIDPAAAPVRVETLRRPGGALSHRIVGLAWGGFGARQVLRLRLRPASGGEGRLERVEAAPAAPWSFWAHEVPLLAPGRYRIEMAIEGDGVSTRRLDVGYYNREFEVPRG
jgi:DMSO/TMAO reductase YedYZ molybdopterin-dependent catalytic subunit